MIAISVIIPVYDVEKYLHDCLDSILSNKTPDIEVICVDDCSPDRCPQIIDDYASRDPRVTAIHLERNGGQGIARNVGLSRAVGEYVYFIDSDDMIETNAFEKLYARAKADDLDGLFFDSRPLFETEELAKRHAGFNFSHQDAYGTGVYTGIDLYREFEYRWDWTCLVQRQLWKREFLEREGIVFPEAYSHEDEFFAYTAILKAERVAYLPEPLFIRRFREGSVMTTVETPRKFYSYLDCFCKMSAFLQENGMTDALVRRGPARIYQHLRRQYAQLGKDELRAWDTSPEMLAVFEGFAVVQDVDELHGNVSQQAIDAAAKAGHLYLYGAGLIAWNAVNRLASFDIPVYGAFVTSLEGNSRALCGHPIIQFDPDYPLEDDALVLITASIGYRDEIEALLDEAGWPHIFYRE